MSIEGYVDAEESEETYLSFCGGKMPITREREPMVEKWPIKYISESMNFMPRTPWNG